MQLLTLSVWLESLFLFSFISWWLGQGLGVGKGLATRRKERITLELLRWSLTYCLSVQWLFTLGYYVKTVNTTEHGIPLPLDWVFPVFLPDHFSCRKVWAVSGVGLSLIECFLIIRFSTYFPGHLDGWYWLWCVFLVQTFSCFPAYLSVMIPETFSCLLCLPLCGPFSCLWPPKAWARLHL